LSQTAIKTFPMAALGLSMTNIIDLTMFVAATNYFIHSRIPLRLGWCGRWLIQSPLHHRLHHLKLYDGRSWNYSICPLWDRMFGTWRDVEQPVEIGIEYAYRHGAWIVHDMLRDYSEFLQGWAVLATRAIGGLLRRPSAAPTPASAFTGICDGETCFTEFRAQQPVPANADPGRETRGTRTETEI
jgi:hypothetical protein